MTEHSAPRRVGRRVAIALALVILAAGGGFLWLQHYYDAPGPAPHAVRVHVQAGDTLHLVFARLGRLGALAHPRVLELYLRLMGRAPRMEIGVYDIPAYSSPAQIVRMFKEGRVVLDKLTVVEGATFAQFLAELDADRDIEPTLRGASDAAVMAALGHPTEQPEGRFFPDTYSFSPGTTDLTVLRMAYDKMTAELARVWRTRSRGLPLHDAYQALILASMIEKETGVADERARIASVFVARAIHLDNLIRPALAAGTWVVSDRFTDATRAYQGGGRGVDAAWIETIAARVHAGLVPDCTLLLDLPVAVGLARARARRAEADRIEVETEAFFARVRAGYLALEQREPQRIRRIDATAPVEAVQDQIRAALAPWLTGSLNP